MERTFASESERKEKLFAAWDDLLAQYHKESLAYDEVYEGLALVSHVAKNIIHLHLESGEIIKNLWVGPHVCEHISRMDDLYIVLGKRGAKWWPLEVLSIASPLNPDGGRH